MNAEKKIENVCKFGNATVGVGKVRRGIQKLGGKTQKRNVQFGGATAEPKKNGRANSETRQRYQRDDDKNEERNRTVHFWKRFQNTTANVETKHNGVLKRSRKYRKRNSSFGTTTIKFGNATAKTERRVQKRDDKIDTERRRS